MFHTHVPFICYLSIPKCSRRLSRAIHKHTVSRLAGAQSTDCMTCLNSQTLLFCFPHTITFLPVFQCLSLHMLELVYVFRYLFISMFSFVCNLSVPVCPHMAQQSNPPTQFYSPSQRTIFWLHYLPHLTNFFVFVFHRQLPFRLFIYASVWLYLCMFHSSAISPFPVCSHKLSRVIYLTQP